MVKNGKKSIKMVKQIFEFQEEDGSEAPPELHVVLIYVLNANILKVYIFTVICTGFIHRTGSAKKRKGIKYFVLGILLYMYELSEIS